MTWRHCQRPTCLETHETAGTEILEDGRLVSCCVSSRIWEAISSSPRLRCRTWEVGRTCRGDNAPSVMDFEQVRECSILGHWCWIVRRNHPSEGGSRLEGDSLGPPIPLLV